MELTNDKLKYREVLPLLFIVYSLFFMVSPANAQQRKIDSLYSLLRTEKEDTNRVNTLIKLSWEFYITGDYNKSDSLCKIVLPLGQKLNFKRGVAFAYNYLGNTASDRGNNPEALNYKHKALKIFQEINNKSGIANVYSGTGNIYQSLGKYPEALKDMLQSLKMYEELGNKFGIAAAYLNSGNVYQSMGNYEDALNNQLKGLKLFEELGNKYGVATGYGAVGLDYASMHKYDEAMKNDLQALKLNEEIGNKSGVSTVYANISDIYFDQNNYEEALKYQLQALEIVRELGHEHLSASYRNIGGILFMQKKYAIVQRYYDSSLTVARKSGEMDDLKEVYKSLSSLDSVNNNYKAAFEDYKNYIIYKDSLSNEENTKKIVQEQMQYDFDKTQAAEKAEQDKKDVVHNEEVKRQKEIIYSISVGLLLVLVLAGFILRSLSISRRKTKIIAAQKAEVDKKNVLIEQQKALVEEKNKDIIDSITYAKRLQSAILPPVSLVKQYFPESFILYKPKDIVAGDFYWMYHIPSQTLPSSGKGEKHSGSFPPPEGGTQGGIVLIAAADCTGHGVPGAMVSVVCSNAINRIVKETEVRDTGSVLDKVRDVVLETFSTSEGEVKDGMDISLCAINQQANILEWTGANNPLWYIHKNKLIEIAPDKQPVGIQDNAKPFTTHLVNIEKGDTIYLFTDGYADQFGGPKGKKFMYKQLKQLLMDSVQLTMEEQKIKLEKTLEEWKGSLEQVDDILMIGIRI